MRRLVVFLITVALFAGIVSCAPVQYYLTIASTEGGSVSTPGEGDLVYGLGAVVNLVATPDAGYRFVNWTGDVDTIADVESAVTTITIDGPYYITANFVAVHSLTIISSAGGFVTTPGEGTFIYDEGTVVSLVAEANDGYRFLNWIGDVQAISNESAASTTIAMDGDYSIGANFAEYLKIWDWHGLHAIRHNLGGNYLLMNDLDANTAGYSELASTTANGGKGWEPVGVYGAEFTGGLNGQGYEIRGLFIDRSDETDVALFGRVGAAGIIEDIGVVHAAVTGRDYVAALVGYNQGTVRKAYSSGSVVGDTGVGGLVGLNTQSGSVWNTYSACTVSGRDYVGGLVGQNNWSTVSHSNSTGSVAGDEAVGGLVGRNHLGTVSYSYSTGAITGLSNVGGLAGSNSGRGAVVSNCYVTGSVTGRVNVGGLVGYSTGTVRQCYSAGRVTGDTHSGGIVGFDVDALAGYVGVVTGSFWDTDASGLEESHGGIGKTTLDMQDILTFSKMSWDIVAVAPGETDESYIWNIVDGQTYPFLSWQSVS